MKQYLVYRDDMGYITTEVIGNISFLDGSVFFSVPDRDGNEHDMELNVEQIVDIGLTDCIEAI